MADQEYPPLADLDLCCCGSGSPDEDDEDCWQCGGDGWGIVGVDWDGDPEEYGADDGEVVKCPCCHGSGKAKDCWYW